MKIKIAAITDVGKERTNNEDAFVVCQDLIQENWGEATSSAYFPLGRCGSLLAVADGMGGANAGEVASALAMKTVKTVFSAQNAMHCVNTGNMEDLLRQSVKAADEAINKRIDEDPETIGMGTTIVLCWIIGDMAHIAWCGDSRCYAYSATHGLRCLTKDHSYVQQLIDSGKISAKQALTHPCNNVITRCLGDNDYITKPDFTSYKITPGDTIMLCTDGLCGYCMDNAIERVFNKHATDTNACCRELIEKALDTGGQDNVTVALASIIDDHQHTPPKPTLFHELRYCWHRIFSS